MQLTASTGRMDEREKHLGNGKSVDVEGYTLLSLMKYKT